MNNKIVFIIDLPKIIINQSNLIKIKIIEKLNDHTNLQRILKIKIKIKITIKILKVKKLMK